MSFALHGKGGHVDMGIDCWEDLVRLAYLYDWKALGPVEDPQDSLESNMAEPVVESEANQSAGSSFTFQLPELMRSKPLPGDEILNPYLCNMISVNDEDAQNLADALERGLSAMKLKGPEYVKQVEWFIE